MPIMDDTTQSRWFHLTPGRFVIGLLAVEGLLFLAEQLSVLPTVWTPMIAVVLVDVAILVMFMWFVVALVFRRRFQFSIRSLLVLVVVVALPYGWLRAERHWNGKGWIAGDRRVCKFLASHDIHKLGTIVRVRGRAYKQPPEESAAAQQFLAYLLTLEDAQAAPVDLLGRVAANSQFHYVTPTGSRTVATVLVCDSYGPGSVVVIYFGDDYDDHICITMSPNVRRAYDTALAAIGAERSRTAE